MSRPFQRFPAVLLASIALAAACGGDSTGPGTSPPPPPPPSPVPATIAVSAGDNQAAFPGDTVPVRPAILVRDGSGRPLSGVAVTFAVESGGGSLATTSGSTNSDGIATAGPWTLGATEGENRLRATVGSLAPVFVAATARFGDVKLEETTVTSGVVTVESHGKPFDGATLTIPAGAFNAPASLTFSAIRQAPIQNDAGIQFHEWGLRIDSDAGFANRMLVLRLPVSAGANERLIPFLYNPANGRFDLLPVLDMTPTSITIGSRHFSRALLELPDVTIPAPRGALPSRSTVETGATIVLAKLNPADFPTASVPFDPVKDGWEFPSVFTPVAPFGLDMGWAISAMHYYRTLRPKLGSLFERFAQVKGTGIPWDNPDGIRLTAVLHKLALSDWNTAAFKADIQPFLDAFQQRGRTYMNQTIVLQVAAALQLTREPVLYLGLGEIRDGVPRMFSFLAYRTSAGSISFAGSRVMGTQTWNTAQSQLSGIRFTDFASSVEETFSVALPLGTTPLYPMRALDPALWGQLADHSVGDSDFPEAWIETRWGDGEWTRSSGSVHVWSDKLEVRTMCPYCPTKRSDIPGSWPGEAGQQWVEAYSPQEALLGDDDKAALKLDTPATPAEQRIGLGLFTFQKARSWHPDRTAYLDYTPLTIKSSRLVLDPDVYTVTVGREVTLESEIQGAAYAGPGRYEWTFSDGTAVFKANGASSAIHIYDKTGTYEVKLVLVDAASGKVLAEDKATVKVVNPVTIWQVTEMSRESVTGQLPADSLNKPNYVTYTNYFKTRDMMDDIIDGYRGGFIHYLDGLTGIKDLYDWDLDGNFAELIQWRESAWLQPNGLPPSSLGERAHYPWPPSITLAEVDQWTDVLDMDIPEVPKVNFGGTLEHGSLTGLAFTEVTTGPGNPKPEGWVHAFHEISATMNGTTMTGMITLTYRAFKGLTVDRTWKVIYSFTAELLP